MEIPPRLQDEVTALARELRAVVQGRFLPKENYHLTLAFLGDVPASLIPDIATVLERVGGTTGGVPLQPNGLGKFGRRDDATLWLGFNEAPELMGLAKCVREGLHAQTIPFDEKPFRPHLTLARRARIPKETLPPLPFPSAANAQKLTLFKSTLSPEGALYEPLHSIWLR